MDMDEKQSILIIEDNKELVDLLVRRFGGSYSITFAMDGEEGLKAFRATRPDMVLLDLSLPKVSGFDVLKEIKSSEAGQDVPVLILTALSDTSNVVTGFSMGADDYVVKPFNFMELSARIKAHLTIRTLQRQLIDMERLNMLREVAVSFNHEINNPLSAISVFAHFLKGRLDTACVECKNSVEGIISEVDRISGIVKKLSEATHAASVDYMPGIKMIDFTKLTDDDKGGPK